MQETFTEKMRKLRSKLDGTIESRREFMSDLHNNVDAMRRQARGFMEQLRDGHADMARRTQEKLGGFRQKRRSFSDDLRGGAEILHRQGASRS